MIVGSSGDGGLCPTNFSLSLQPEWKYKPPQTEGTSDQVSSTRSGVMNLARRFNAGITSLSVLVA
jgi:hypothetical protein